MRTERDPVIHRRPDGTIDTARYAARGRTLQRAALRTALVWLGRRLLRLVPWFRAPRVRLPAPGRSAPSAGPASSPK